MIWNGKNPLTVGFHDDDGNVLEACTVQPGEVIPPKWLKLMAETGEENTIDIDDDGHYDPLLVKEAVLRKGRLQ